MYQHVFLRSLIGTPWVAGGRNPEEGFDCWGLLVHIYDRLFKIELDAHPGVNSACVASVVSAVKEEVPKWQELEAPEPFCAVGMSMGHVISHVGIWVDNGVLHTGSDRGCVFQTIASIRHTFKTIKYYRYVSSSPHQ